MCETIGFSDWCILRQLWWGHRIPAYFVAVTDGKIFIVFQVYLHAMIRDAHGRKMSKSLGNVIDPLDVIRGVTLAELNHQLTAGNLDAKELAIAQASQVSDYPKLRRGYQPLALLTSYIPLCTSNQGIVECGTDALRFALLAYTSQGRDISLDVLRVQDYRFFCNKIWQAVRFTLMQLGSEYKARPFADYWLSLSEAVGIPINPYTCLFNIPPRFMISGSTICVTSTWNLLSQQSHQYPFNVEQVEADVAFAVNVIRKVRSLRPDYELTNKTKTDVVYASVGSEDDHRCLTLLIPLTETLASSNKVEVLLHSTVTPESIPSGCAHVTILSRCSVDIGLQGIINVERELVKLVGKKEKNEALVAELLQQEGRPDYEEKVPLPVRVANTEKKEALLVEMKSIEAAIAAFSG
ncbi:hypothetical protein OESDEN_01706 [Oesophagostomum dentatum]|uniref:valine--tRNA ligase n=1 Tax=Oesophagostomum dentatum TaxID=61180 RepID=A0A0B1TL70_OESDE|nr:hypothetical protein OESDEN_01706 [Oesophagostomum dentatum]